MSEKERLTPERLAELREIAEGPTTGRWRIPAANVFRVVAPETMNQGDPRYRWAVIADTDPQSVSGEEAAATARHIATFDPPTVLALLDEIERLAIETGRVLEEDQERIVKVARVVLRAFRPDRDRLTRVQWRALEALEEALYGGQEERERADRRPLYTDAGEADH